MKHKLSSHVALLAALALVAGPASTAFAQEASVDAAVTPEGRPVRVMMKAEVRGEAANRGAVEVRAIKLAEGDKARVEVRSEMAPTLVGRITAVSGTTLTVEGKTFGTSSKAMATSTYSVNVAGAKIVNGAPEQKDRKATTTATTTATTSVAKRTVADLKVGDHVVVRGTLTGTTVVATEILTGKADGKGNIMVKIEDRMEKRAEKMGSTTATGTPAFLRKVGGFFKNLFGKREAKFEARINATTTASTTVQQ